MVPVKLYHLFKTGAKDLPVLSKVETRNGLTMTLAPHVAFEPSAAPNLLPGLHILLAAPRGFCAGVDRAIQIVELALQKYGAPVYVRHEIVHNRFVVESLRAKGAVFVEELDEIPQTAQPVIFSAHGVAKSVPASAKHRNLFVLDATCPLVFKVHNEAARHHEQGHEIVLIGHAGHPEVVGTLGQLPDGAIRLIETSDEARAFVPHDETRLAYVTQTTLSVDDTAAIVEALRLRYPELQAPRKEDICYATQNRQDAVKQLLEQCEVLIVVGSKTSSNSNRLRELADRAGQPGYLVDGADDLQRSWFIGLNTVGVTAGASAPERLVQQVVERLRSWGGAPPAESYGKPEHVVFALPRALR